jgi:rhodanese-related sulfurtransferase
MPMSSSEQPEQIEVDPERLLAWLGEDPGVQVIDVREPHEHDAGHIDGTRHIPLGSLTAEAATVDRERPVVFYCRVGARSLMAAQAFRAAGFPAYSMSGGLARWAQEGRPLAPEGGEVADH